MTVLVVNVTLAAILGAAHGATAPRTRRSASEVVGLAVAFAVLRIPPGRRPVARVTLRVALAGGVGLLVGARAGLPSVVDALLGSAAYVAVVVALGAVPRELLEAVRPGDAAYGNGQVAAGVDGGEELLAALDRA